MHLPPPRRHRYNIISTTVHFFSQEKMNSTNSLAKASTTGRPPLLNVADFWSREKATIILCPNGHDKRLRSMDVADATSLEAITTPWRLSMGIDDADTAAAAAVVVAALLVLVVGCWRFDDDESKKDGVGKDKGDDNRGKVTPMGISFRKSTKTFFQPSESKACDMCARSSKCSGSLSALESAVVVTSSSSSLVIVVAFGLLLL
mmetsp:Transcript_11504/g.19134  ORF Transcript_11504/g.19134 Transcript_11504/m.19134 type:complete len:204 (+) Transcript_11504:356-967(+)